MGLGDFLNNVVNSIPVVGHIKGGIHGLVGDVEGEREAIQAANSCTSAVLNSIPVVGHAKGLIHQMAGDREGAKEAYRSANRSSLVIGAAAVAGPAGAAAAAVSTGVAMDSVETLSTGTAVGYWKNVGDILDAKGVTDVMAGVGKMALDVGCDVVAGSAGGAISSAARMPFKLALMNEAPKEIARAVGVTVTRNTEKEAVGYALDHRQKESGSRSAPESTNNNPESDSEYDSESSGTTASSYRSGESSDDEEKEKKKRTERGYIYFFRCEGGLYKFGMSTRDIKKIERLREHMRNKDRALRPKSGTSITVYECDHALGAERIIKDILSTLGLSPSIGHEYFHGDVRISKVIKDVVEEVNSQPLAILDYEVDHVPRKKKKKLKRVKKTKK